MRGAQCKALIFGAMGQDGYYLAENLAKRGITVARVSRSGGDCVGNVADGDTVSSLMKSHRPGFIFNLSAVSSTHHEALLPNHDAIVTGTLNILESARIHCPAARIFLPGSALQFRNDGVPINEASPFDASSAYAVSRIHSTYLGRYFRSTFNMNVYCGFLFNHDSPRRTALHINKAIADAAGRIAAGSLEKLPIGNPEVRKEFGFAGDTVEAIWRLVNQDSVHEAAIGTGVAYSIRNWAEVCFGSFGLDVNNYLVVEEGYQSPYRILVSDPAVIQGLGWRPAVGFEELAEMMVRQPC